MGPNAVDPYNLLVRCYNRNYRAAFDKFQPHRICITDLQQVEVIMQHQYTPQQYWDWLDEQAERQRVPTPQQHPQQPYQAPPVLQAHSAPAAGAAAAQQVPPAAAADPPQQPPVQDHLPGIEQHLAQFFMHLNARLDGAQQAAAPEVPIKTITINGTELSLQGAVSLRCFDFFFAIFWHCWRAGAGRLLQAQSSGLSR